MLILNMVSETTFFPTNITYCYTAVFLFFSRHDKESYITNHLMIDPLGNSKF